MWDELRLLNVIHLRVLDDSAIGTTAPLSEIECKGTTKALELYHHGVEEFHCGSARHYLSETQRFSRAHD